MDPKTGVREFDLGDAGIAYIRETLGSGGPLAQALDGLDLKAGIATTFLPSEVVEPPRRLQDGLGYLYEHDSRRRKHDFELMMQATRDKVMSHFLASEGQGWAASEDRYKFGTYARFTDARIEGRETRFRVARAGEWSIFYHLGSADEHDVADFLEAARVRANVSALGVGGPIAPPGQGGEDWDEDVLSRLAEHVRFIVCEAFDEEGLVFWKNPN